MYVDMCRYHNRCHNQTRRRRRPFTNMLQFTPEYSSTELLVMNPTPTPLTTPSPSVCTLVAPDLMPCISYFHCARIVTVSCTETRQREQVRMLRRLRRRRAPGVYQLSRLQPRPSVLPADPRLRDDSPQSLRRPRRKGAREAEHRQPSPPVPRPDRGPPARAQARLAGHPARVPFRETSGPGRG